MKRLTLAWCILGTIIIACLCHQLWLNREISVIADNISGAQEYLNEGDIQRSAELLRRAREQYDSSEIMFSITINEKQLDEVCLNFARAQTSSVSGDKAQYAVELSGLHETVTDLRRSEVISFGNLF